MQRKVLFYSTIFSSGGAERFLLDLVNNIDLNRFKVILVIGRKNGVSYKEFLKNDKNIEYINLGFEDNEDHLIYKKLAEKIDDIKPDICFGIGIFTNFILLDAINEISYTGKVILRESNYISMRKNLPEELRKKFLEYNRSDKIVALTKGMKKDISRYGVNKTKITTINNIIDADSILKQSNEKIKNDIFNKITGRKIIHVGRLEEQKNHKLLFDAFKIVSDNISDVELVVLGKGSLEEELKRYVYDIGIANKVHFLGFQDNPYNFIKKSDLVVLSSLYEGLPHILLETMLLKVPIVSTNCKTGPKDIFKGNKYGYLVENNNIESMANKIISLLNDDKKLYKKVNKAYNRALNYSTDVVVEKYENLFDDIINIPKKENVMFKKKQNKDEVQVTIPVDEQVRNLGVKVGKNFSVTGRVNYSSEPYLISIGDDVRISDNVNFVTHDGGMHVIRQYKNIPADSFGKIVVGNNVFIGMNSLILPGVTIGDNVIIGAGSIVTKDIPNNSVACGVPAKVIESIDEYYKKNKKNIELTKNMTPEEKKEYLIKKYKI